MQKSILDSSFKYTPSTETDIAKTFARIRKERAKADKLLTTPSVSNIKIGVDTVRLVSYTGNAESSGGEG